MSSLGVTTRSQTRQRHCIHLRAPDAAVGAIAVSRGITMAVCVGDIVWDRMVLGNCGPWDGGVNFHLFLPTPGQPLCSSVMWAVNALCGTLFLSLIGFLSGEKAHQCRFEFVSSGDKLIPRPLSCQLRVRL